MSSSSRFSSMLFRAKLSRLPFKKRLLLAIPAAGSVYFYRWRRSVGECDESLLLAQQGEGGAAALASSVDQQQQQQCSELPFEARDRKWRQLVQRSDEFQEGSEKKTKKKKNSAGEEASTVDSAPFDLIVVGAGANGLFVTLEAARRGLSVATFDACDVGGTNSSSGVTPNLLASFMPHVNRAVRIFSAEEFWQAWQQLLELRRMRTYTRSAADAQGAGWDGIVRSDVGMAVPTASKVESVEILATSVLWSFISAAVGAPSPTRGSSSSSSLLPPLSPLLPFRTICPKELTLASDWVGDDGMFLEDDAGEAKTRVPSRVFYFNHARLNGNKMAVAIAHTAELLGKGGKRAAPTEGSAPSSSSSSSSSLKDEGRVVVLNYCPVQSISVCPKTGLYNVMVRNIRPSTSTTTSAADGTHSSLITLKARNVVNCSGPWVDSLRRADLSGSVGSAVTREETTTTTSGGGDAADADVIAAVEAEARAAATFADVTNGGGRTTTAEEGNTPMKASAARPHPNSLLRSAFRSVLSQSAPEKATGYDVRESLANRDYFGHHSLMSSNTGHIYFVVPNSVVKGIVKRRRQDTNDKNVQQASSSSSSSSLPPTLEHVSAVTTLTTDAARRYITVSPFTATTSLVGLAAVPIPQLGWRGTPSASGLPFVDPSTHFKGVYEWMKKSAAQSGIDLPPQPLSCALSASGVLAPLSPIAREVYQSDGAVEVVGCEGSLPASRLYHVVGGNWLTARRLAADIVRDVRRNAIAEREGLMPSILEADARRRRKEQGEETLSPEQRRQQRQRELAEDYSKPSLLSNAALRRIDGRVRGMVEKEEAAFAKPIVLVPPPSAAAASSTTTATTDDGASSPPATIAEQLTAAMVGDPYTTTIVDVIARRTTVAYTHHAPVTRMLPLLVEAMAGEHKWSKGRKAEELQSAKWFLEGIAPPSA